jgi:membrane-associated phospholipid phosphatase
MKQRLLFVFFGFFFLFSFYIFSGWVRLGKTNRISFDTTVKLQEKMPKRFDGTWDDLTFFVGQEMSIVILLILTASAFVEFKKKRVVLAALFIPLFFSLLIGAELYGKDKVESPAPPFFMLKNPTTIFPKYHVQDKYSYPSGHAARSLFFTLVIGAIAYRKSRNWITTAGFFSICLTLTFLISLAKVYLGHHWISDVFGGYLLAMGFGFFFLASYLPRLEFSTISIGSVLEGLPIAEFHPEENKKVVPPVHKKKK